MKKNFFIIIFFVFFSSLLQTKSYAYSSDPKQFIAEIVAEAKKILVESNSKEFKSKKLSEIALKTVDINGLAYYTLGKKRKELSKEELEKRLKTRASDQEESIKKRLSHSIYELENCLKYDFVFLTFLA